MFPLLELELLELLELDELLELALLELLPGSPLLDAELLDVLASPELELDVPVAKPIPLLDDVLDAPVIPPAPEDSSDVSSVLGGE